MIGSMYNECERGYKSFGLHSRKEMMSLMKEHYVAYDIAFANRFMELCQDYFATLYGRVSAPVWNNSIYGYVKRAYYTCNFDVGVAEYYVPTVLNGENFMQCHRIVVVVLPELDKETYESEIVRLISPLSPPLGFIDSTTIFVVAPKVTRKHALMVLKEKFKAMLKIKRVAGCFAIPIVSPVPEIAFKKLISHIKNFWEKRVKAFLDRLKIQPWMYDYKIENIISITVDYLKRVIEKYNSQIIHSLRSMIAHFTYFSNCVVKAAKSIGRLSMLKAKLLRFAEMMPFLEPEKREEIFMKIQECTLTIRSARQPKPP
jgi:hypothetical protein